ncbi:hypothetical protein [Ideonella sp.]|uniref:hypothetical protein n=1 Tax=Ideonella sp. TaxID=1929293 RepID=UPI0035AF5872
MYRYTSIDRVTQMIDQKALTLVSPRKWHDPYEEWWCDQLFAPGSQLATAHAFGSCWTVSYLDEPRWRLYACICDEEQEPLPAVRIATTVGKLVDALVWSPGIDTSKAYIGRVRYPKRSAELTRIAVRLRDGGHPQIANSAANALYTKRYAYRFEDEVRVLWIDRSKRRDLHEIPIQPMSFIDQVMIGPTKSEAHVAAIAGKLLDRGFPSDRIRESGLYRRPRELPPEP